MRLPLRHHRRHHGKAIAFSEQENRAIDEVLERIWTMREENINDITKLHEQFPHMWLHHTLEKMTVMDLIEIENGTVYFTHEGEERAKQIIRRHRLAERLLSEVLQVNEGVMEASACSFEHVLNPHITDSICTLLGHPPTCPHGKPIPRGKCCERYAKKIEPILVRLSNLAPGQEGTVAFISPKHHSRLDRLGSFGIIPGTRIHMHQKEPALIIRIGETDLALEKDIADDIYVRII